MPDQAHAGLLRRATTLFVVAPEACGHDVVPLLLAATRHRNHVIERQVYGREFLSAVLTRIVVAGVNVRSRKLHFILVLDSYVAQQSDDRR